MSQRFAGVGFGSFDSRIPFQRCGGETLALSLPGIQRGSEAGAITYSIGAQVAGMRTHKTKKHCASHRAYLSSSSPMQRQPRPNPPPPPHAGGQCDQSGLDTFLRPSRCCKGEHAGIQHGLSRAQVLCCSTVCFAARGGVGGWGLRGTFPLALLLFPLRASRFSV